MYFAYYLQERVKDTGTPIFLTAISTTVFVKSHSDSRLPNVRQQGLRISCCASQIYIIFCIPAALPAVRRPGLAHWGFNAFVTIWVRSRDILVMLFWAEEFNLLLFFTF